MCRLWKTRILPSSWTNSRPTTPITDDELYAISYDKTARVKEGHANSINDAKFTKAAHALCANKNTETTPVT